MKNIKYIRFLILCAFIIVFSMNAIQAQKVKTATTTITGQVVDENGLPVPGIMVKSWLTQAKAVTDEQGNFNIDVARDLDDNVTIATDGYKISVVATTPGNQTVAPIVIVKTHLIDGNNIVELPYDKFRNNQITSAVYTVTGAELASYPSTVFLETLAGRIPGLTIDQVANTPGQEFVTANIRGEAATIYIDGIVRDITGLAVGEVDKVEVFKDFAGRGALGLIGAGPVIWITTRKGTAFKKEVNFTAETGFRTPTTLPEYVNSYNYASLLNEALVNDGLPQRYSAADLALYQDGTYPDRYPNIDYYNNYVNKSSAFRKANLNFFGGNNNVTYFSMFDYAGNQGLEAVGNKITNDQYKLRGNVDIKLNDFIRLSVNISGSYQKQVFPNTGSGAEVYNMFDILSTYPSNAHTSYFENKLMMSDDYPVSLNNELLYSGYGEGSAMNAQNDAKLIIDLDRFVKGLSVVGSTSMDAFNNLITSKGGTAALYRLEKNVAGTADTARRVVEALNVAEMSLGNYYVGRRTAANLEINYERQFGKHLLSADANYYMALEEFKIDVAGYQPTKMQDLSARVNYSFDNRYTLQVDLAYTGSGRMPKGERFSLYPNVSAAWVASNEGFLKGISAINYLKLFTSFGVMGVNNFALSGYNPFYLTETLWRQYGTWRSGYYNNYGVSVANYNIIQAGTTSFVLPKKSLFNVGIQSELFGKTLSLEANYFYEKNYDKISNKAGMTPSILGSSQFLPAVNFGEDMRWGFDGMIQFKMTVGDFSYGIGANALYSRSKYLVVDEPSSLEPYKKLAGKDMDLFWLYKAEGLFQTAGEITSNTVSQSWGAVQPGDIKYLDYNNDNVIDENDMYTPGAHYPRVFYGVNLSAGYKGFNLYILGQGVADGETRLTSDRYFWVNGTKQNYSELMLDRWPATNNYPRLTTISQNNYQQSTFWLTNAAYFKVKNVELSYTLPLNISKNMGTSNFRVFARGTNLMALSGLKKYNLDPENINAGINGYPLFKTVTFGLSCKF